MLDNTGLVHTADDPQPSLITPQGGAELKHARAAELRNDTG
jgi:hypothetical protein